MSMNSEANAPRMALRFLAACSTRPASSRAAVATLRVVAPAISSACGRRSLGNILAAEQQRGVGRVLLPIGAEFLQHPSHLRLVEHLHVPQRECGTVLGSEILDLTGQRQRGAWIRTQSDDAVVGQQTRFASLDRCHRGAGELLCAEGVVGGTADVDAACHGDHVVKRRYCAPGTRKRSCVSGMRVHDRTCIAACKVDVTMEPPLAGGAPPPEPAALDVY